MKNTKTITLAALLALLATGCSKDKGDIRIFAENMSPHGSKVWVDPANVSASASWIAGETIDLNGNSQTIAGDATDGFYLQDCEPLSTDMYAVYPFTTTASGNDVTVVNNQASGATVTLNRLAVNFNGGGHDIIFPMAAKATANAGGLRFNHLTGGFRLTLSASTAVTIQTVKVIVYGTGSASSVPLEGVTYTVKWAEDGPTLPSGNVGDIGGDYDIKYASVMYFDMKTGDNNGVEVSSAGTTFCVPVTVTNVKRLTVIGYGTGGETLFEKTRTLDNVAVERNNMYTIPNIQIN